MFGEIILQFVDPAFDHTETVEISSITELSILAFNMKKSEGAENVNFNLTEQAENLHLWYGNYVVTDAEV